MSHLKITLEPTLQLSQQHLIAALRAPPGDLTLVTARLARTHPPSLFPTGQTQTVVHGSPPHLVLHDTGSACMANTKQSPRRQSRAESQSGRVSGRTRGGDGTAERALTWEDEDEEGADASDDADDLADVRDKHGDGQRGYEPQHRQRVAAAVLQLRRRPAATPPPPAQQRLLDH